MRDSFEGEEVVERRVFVKELGREEEDVELDSVRTEAEHLDGVEELDEVLLGDVEGGSFEEGKDGGREREGRGKVVGDVGKGRGLFGRGWKFLDEVREE